MVGLLPPLWRRKRFSAFIRKRLVFFLRPFPSGEYFPLPIEEIDDPSSRGGEASDNSDSEGSEWPLAVSGAVMVVTGTLEGRSSESRLMMLVPWVLGDNGSFPVVALVACDAQSPVPGTEALPSVASLLRCRLDE